MDRQKHKLGIIGIGFVGGALQKYFQFKKVKLYLYDKFKNIGSVDEINQADVIFICVSTPYNIKTGFDLSAVQESIKILTNKKIIIIKSTVVPGTTEKLQKQYLQHKFIFNPEFLREVSAYNDLVYPDRQILGITKQSKNIAKDIFKILPKSKHQLIMNSTEAVVVKYMSNSFLALKVVFANEFYDLCKKLKINYEDVKLGTSKDPRIGESHLEIFHNNKRGYGGSCFPKDVNAIIQFANKNKVNMPLLNQMREINRKLLKQSGLAEGYYLDFGHRKKNEKK